MNHVRVIAIAGASGSGKSFLAAALLLALKEVAPAKSVASLSLDAYYRDLSHLDIRDREQVNFDHPEALDLDLFAAQLNELKQGVGVMRPRYNFSAHTRDPDLYFQAPTDFLIVDGLMLTAAPSLRALYDLLVFVDTNPELCFQRRLQRDIEQRGRTRASVKDFWEGRALPMFELFGASAAADADLVLPGDLPIINSVNRIMSALGTGVS